MKRDESESRYLTLFEDSPVGLWEEDFSGVKRYLDDLRNAGVNDFRKYFEENPQAILKCADLVQIKRVNKATLQLQGVEKEEDLLGSLGDILIEDAMELFRGEVLALAEGKYRFESTVVISTVTGKTRHILFNLSVPEEFRDSLEMVIISMLDITDAVMAKAELEKALEMAAFYNDLMAHDLSNMHQGIVSSMELLLHSGRLPKDLEPFVEAALLQSQRGAAIIHHVKKLAAIDQGTNELNAVDPYFSLATAIEMAGSTFPQKEASFETNLNEGEYLVTADEFLVDVFYNLFHNSIQYDPSHRVSITVSVEKTDDDSLLFRIIDRGPGIDDSKKQSIFLEPEPSRKHISGIGLTLVKRIVERYGGKLQIEDTVEGDHSQGTCFVFTIPLCK